MDVILKGYLREFQLAQGLDGLSDDALFEAFVAYCVVSPILEDHIVGGQLRTGGQGDLGIDALAILINNELYTDPTEVRETMAVAKRPRVHFIVIQAKLNPPFASKVFTEVAENLVHIFTAPELALNCSKKIKKFRACVEAIYEEPKRLGPQRPRLSVWYATPGRASLHRLEAKRSAAEERLDHSGAFEAVMVRSAGAAELKEMYRRTTEAPTATVRVADKMRAVIPPMPGIRRAFTGVVLARDLVKNVLTDQSGILRQSLFSDNVRDFLPYGINAVNTKIQTTLRDADLRRRFAVLNNGITIVARELTPVKDTLVMRGYHIVNGCQTCNVLFDELPNLDDDVYVTVRIIEAEDDGVTDSIVAATNQQTAITERDLEALGAFHRTLEQYFRAHPPARRLYYERRAKQYLRQDVEQTRVISRTDLTRAYAAMFLGEPWRIGRINELLASHHVDLFKPGSDPLPYYTSASVLYRLDWLFRNRPHLADYRPTKFMLMFAIRLRLIGAERPQNAAELTAACEKILDQVWHPAAAEQLVAELLPALRATIDAEADGDLDTAAAARTERFAERLHGLVLGTG